MNKIEIIYILCVFAFKIVSELHLLVLGDQFLCWNFSLFTCLIIQKWFPFDNNVSYITFFSQPWLKIYLLKYTLKYQKVWVGPSIMLDLILSGKCCSSIWHQFHKWLANLLRDVKPCLFDNCPPIPVICRLGFHVNRFLYYFP